MANTGFDTDYAALMERVQVTPEIRERVLANVVAAVEEEAVAEERKGFRLFSGGLKATHILGIAACLVIALVVGTTLLNRTPAETDNPGGDNPGNVAITAPDELATAEELAAAVGVPVPEVPALDGDAMAIEYVSLWGEIAEVRYQLPEGRADLRVSPETGDNSGDYNEYSVEETFEYGGVTVTLKGSDDGNQLAIWDQDGYGVSLRFDEPVARDALVTCVESVIDAL